MQHLPYSISNILFIGKNYIFFIYVYKKLFNKNNFKKKRKCGE